MEEAFNVGDWVEWAYDGTGIVLDFQDFVEGRWALIDPMIPISRQGGSWSRS